MFTKNNQKSALVILGGGRNSDGSLTNLSKGRLNEALASTADYIIVMGSTQKTYLKEEGAHKFSGADIRKEYLIEKHIIPIRIFSLNEPCMDTIFEAFASRKIAEDNNIKKIFLGTSVNHMNRALWIFRRIYNRSFQIYPTDNPCSDDLNSELENKMLIITKDYFEKLPQYVPYPNNWDEWYYRNEIFYKDIQKVVKEYKNKSGNYSEAHKTIFANKN